MESQEEVLDSPTGWVAKHIDTYVKTGGEQGHTGNAFPPPRLTPGGRKPGKLRRTALIYGQDAARYLLVASRGGAPKPPLWYLNLDDTPDVELQVGTEVFAARPRTATAEE